VLDTAKGLFDAGITATQGAQRATAYGDLQDLLIDEVRRSRCMNACGRQRRRHG
jgi:hypothetical protein